MEILVDFYCIEFEDSISIGSFREDVSHGGFKRLDFWFFLSVCRMLLWRETSFRPMRISLSGWLLLVKRRGHGSRIDGFGGWTVMVIFVGLSERGLHRVGIRKVNRITN